MKPLGLIELTMAAGVSLMLSTPALAEGWHGHHHSHSSSSGTQKRYHYAVGYRNGGGGYGFRSYGGLDTRTGYTGPHVSINRPHRAAWNAYIRKQARRREAEIDIIRPDCGFNRSPLDCRVVPHYDTVVTVR